MELDGARVVVAGATGVLGSGISRALAAQGARLGLAGRGSSRLDELAAELGGPPTAGFDALDLERCAGAVDDLVAALGGLDAIVVALGVAAFGRAEEADDVVVEHLLTVNTMAPIALVRAALPHLGRGGAVAVLSAVLADHPTAGMAAYSASKAGLSGWLTALRHEQRRRGVTVFDVRPPHLDTGLDGRGLTGTPPPLPEPVPSGRVVDLVVQGLREGARELVADLRTREVSLRS